MQRVGEIFNVVNKSVESCALKNTYLEHLGNCKSDGRKKKVEEKEED